MAHRRPYEVLLLLQPLHMFKHQRVDQPASHATGSAPGDLSSGGEEAQPAFHAIPLPPDGLVMIAVPGEHSRKPQLAQLLQPYLPERACCLEVRCTIQSASSHAVYIG